MTSTELLMVFARAPEPGRAKTRLAATLGDEAAAALHGAFVLDVLDAHTRSDRRVVLYRTGDLRHALWSQVDPHVEQREQGEGDLGARMASAFAACLAESPGSRVIVLGTDSPALPPGRVDAAFAALIDHDAVVGPADDGGYYLLGLRRPCPALFEGIAWGTSRVFEDTRARLLDANCRWALLDPEYDVDVEADLVRLGHDVGALRSRGEPWPIRTATMLEALGLAQTRGP